LAKGRHHETTTHLFSVRTGCQACVVDPNANHVIQKVISVVPTDQLRIVITTFYGHGKSRQASRMLLSYHALVL
jgi:hypothetical protein